jgi:hypothetical protein
LNLIIGNCFTFFGELVDLSFGIKFNEKSKVLIGGMLSLIFTGIGYIFLGAWDGLLNAIICLIRLIVTYFKDKYNKKFTFLFFIFLGMYFIPFLTDSGPQTIFITIAVICVFIPKWFCKNVQYIRIGTLFHYILFIIYNFYINNYSSIIFEIIGAIGLIIGLIKWKFTKKE